MGRAIELSLLAIIVIIVAFYVIPKIMIEFGKTKAKQIEQEKPKITVVTKKKDESEL